MNINIYKGMEVTADIIDKKFNLIKSNFAKEINIPYINQIYLLYQYLPHFLYPYIYKIEQILSYDKLSVKEIIKLLSTQNIKDNVYIEGEDWFIDAQIYLDSKERYYIIYLNDLVRNLSVDKKRCYKQIFEIKNAVENLFLAAALPQEDIEFLPLIGGCMYENTSYKLYSSYLKHNKLIEIEHNYEKNSIFHQIYFTLEYEFVDELYNKHADDEISFYKNLIRKR